MPGLWPEALEYCDAVQSPHISFIDSELKGAVAVQDDLGLPRASSGNFAVVFQMHSADAKRSWAVKCFTRQIPGLRERYRLISEHLIRAKLPATVAFQYLEEGILIRGERFPILKMDWVEGQTLYDFVQRNYSDRRYLSRLFEIWLRVEPMLRKSQTVHGDLQHGNVLLVPGHSQGRLTLRLIDYDGLWTPELAGSPSGELGHAAYQHPQRARHGLYTADLDRFPHLVIAAALRCLTQPQGREWWQAFDNGDNLLFTRRDFEAPARSRLLHEMWDSGNNELRSWAGLVATAAASPLESTVLLEQRCDGGQLGRLTPEEESVAREILDAPLSQRSVKKSITHPEAAPAATFPALAETQAYVPAGESSPPRWRISDSWHWIVASGLTAATVMGLLIWQLVAPNGTPTNLSQAPEAGPQTPKTTISGENDVISRQNLDRSQESAATQTSQGPPPAIAVAPFSAEQAVNHQQKWADHFGVPVEYVNTIGMKFRLIPPGEFEMGSTPEQIEAEIAVARDDFWKHQIRSELPQHTVILTKPFYMSVHEVGQTYFERVMGKNPSHFAANGDGQQAVTGVDTAMFPVETVNWHQAVDFCTKLSEREKLRPSYANIGDEVTTVEGTGYRLPTEAEWEFACRAGTRSRFWTGEEDTSLIQGGWFEANSAARTHAAGELRANPLGLYDTHGNVWEWVQDSWAPSDYAQFVDKAAINPGGPVTPRTHRVLRGGSWAVSPSLCRSTYRLAHGSAHHDRYIGFRLALPVDAVKSPTTKGGPAAVDSMAAELRSVRVSYQARIVESAATFLKEFDAEEQRIKESDDKVEEKLRRYDQLVAEKAAFEADRRLPETPGLQPAATSYRQSLDKARSACLAALDSLREKHLRDPGAVEQIEAEKVRILGVKKPAKGFDRLLEISTDKLNTNADRPVLQGEYAMLSLSRSATAISTKGMFYREDADHERLIFDDWGPKTVGDVPFQLVDPQGDRVPNVIVLHSSLGQVSQRMPKSVFLPCGMPAKAIHFLSGVSGWGFPVVNNKRGTISLIIRLHYADGAIEDHEQKNGEQFADYVSRVDVPGSQFAFRLRNQQIRFLSIAPQRADVIERIELIKGPDDTAPVVMAITVERPLATSETSAKEQSLGLSGQFGLEFNGVDAYVEILNYRYLNGDPITLEAIVTPYRLQGMQCVLTDFESAGIGLALPGNRWSWGGWNSKTIVGTISDQAVPLNATAYLAGVYDGEIFRLFIDGKLQSTVKELNGGIKSSGMPFLIGANPDQKGTIKETIHGRIDAVRISKGALYVETYKPPASFITTPETLVLLNFEEGSGDITKDESGHGYDGRIIAGKWVKLTDEERRTTNFPSPE